MKRLFTIFVAAALAASLLAACGSSASTAPSQPASEASSQPASASLPASTSGATTKLVVGASPAPHAEILEQVVPILAEQGIELEIKVFNDYVVPNTALNDGSLDANYFQHKPYLDDFNAKNGLDLVSAAAIHFEPLGIYPGKSNDLAAIKDGAVIGVPNDATNEARALKLLEAQGLITLPEGIGFEAVPADIIDNPHKIKFVELEAAQLPASLPDLDFAVINGNYAVGANIADTVLVTESKDSDSAQTFANIIAVRKGDENRPEIKALIAALESEQIRTFILETYKGVVVPVF